MLMETLIIVGITALVTWKICSVVMVLNFRKILQDLGVTNEQLLRLKERAELELADLQAEFDKTKAEPEYPVIEVKLEQHQGQIYAFRKDTDQFMGQGPDRESLLKRLAEQNSNFTMVVAKEDGAELIKQ